MKTLKNTYLIKFGKAFRWVKASLGIENFYRACDTIKKRKHKRTIKVAFNNNVLIIRGISLIQRGKNSH